MITRRRVVIALGASALVAPLLSLAQQSTRIPRIGLFSIGTNPDNPVNWAPFFERMRGFGYVETRNVAYERRFLRGAPELARDVALDLVKLPVDILVATGTKECTEAKRATTTIPIVMVLPAEPVEQKLIASLARPGGNVTGLALTMAGLFAKRVELLKEVAPASSRMLLFTDPTDPSHESYVAETRAAAKVLGITVLTLVEVVSGGELRAKLAAVKLNGADMMLVSMSAIFFANRGPLQEFALKHRLPAAYSFLEDVDAGGLLAYSPSFPDQFARSATFVDKILKGAKPADLPVEQPTIFVLAVNMKTAKALGIRIPNSILVRATKVIE